MVTSGGAVCGMRFPRTVLPFIRSVLNDVFPSSRLFTQAFHIVLISSFCAAIGPTLVKASPQQPPASAAGPNSVEGVTAPMEPVVPSEFLGDLRNLPQLTPSSLTLQRPTLPVRRAPRSNRTFGAPPTLGAQQAQPPPNILVPLTPAPSPTQNFPGLSFSDLCGSPTPTTRCGGGIPPDTNGDVGPNHYIEAVNTAYAIYSKTGTLLVALTEDQLWSASGSTTPCGNGNAAGDPVVVYDPIGDRWILTHIGSAFSNSNPPAPTPPFYECIAVSKTGDPVAGGWWFYPLRMDPGGTGAPPMGTFNDYPKFGIWTDCLYMSANGFNGAAFTGAMYASMSRSDLESGATLTWSLGFLSNTPNPSPFTMIPSTLRGAPPPAGSSCFVGVQFTPTATGQRSASISVADNAPAAPQITSLSGVGVDFNVAAAPPTMMTVAAGANAGFTIDLSTTGGPTGNTITFSASGNPAGTSVTFAPPSVPPGTAPSSTPIAMTITTTRRSSGWPTSLPFDSPPQPRLLLHFGLCLAVGSTLLLLKPSRLKQRKLIGVSFLGVVLLACAALQGCASTGNAAGMGTPGGTPAGTSTITVTATSGSISRTTTVMLTVQ